MNRQIASLYNIYDIENLWDIISRLDSDNANIFKPQTKNIVLSVLKKMLAQKVIYIGNEWIGNNHLQRLKLSNKEIINRIDKIWTKNAKFPELYTFWIGYENWYRDELAKVGMTETTDWFKFVEHKIGDLEKWIEENRPKE